jgi:ABC-2 type transport system ATP-binding protein
MTIAARPQGRESPRPRVGSAIQIEGLTKVYDGRRVLDQLTFEVGWGKVTGFLGPNGAGKTTTIRAMLDLVRPDGGTAKVLGRRYVDLDAPAKTVGAVLESTWFHPRRTARNHLRVVAAAAGLDDRRVARVLDIVDLAGDADRRVGGFSLGMRQRLGLAAALLGPPEILVLDEPANGLDPAGIRWLRASLRRFADRGHAVFVSSHLLAEVSHLADDVIVIDHGRLVAHGSVADLTRGAIDLEEAFFDLLAPKEDE